MRRKTDRLAFRVIVGLCILNALTGTLAAVIGAKSLFALNDFMELTQAIKSVHERRSLRDF